LGDTLLNVSGVHGIEATFSLSRALELGHKAVNRGAVVEREALLLGNQKDIDRLDLLTETARRFLHVAADQQRLVISQDAIDLVRLTEKTVEKRIQSGKTPIAERHRVAIDHVYRYIHIDSILNVCLNHSSRRLVATTSSWLY
jgi:hypothetical protein